MYIKMYIFIHSTLFIIALFLAIMEKCIVCRKEICKNGKDVCETCLFFFEWKYESKSEEKIALFRELRNEEKKQARSKSVRGCR